METTTPDSEKRLQPKRAAVDERNVGRDAHDALAVLVGDLRRGVRHLPPSRVGKVGRLRRLEGPDRERRDGANDDDSYCADQQRGPTPQTAPCASAQQPALRASDLYAHPLGSREVGSGS